MQNVAPKPGNPKPRMIARMVEILTTMIRPASPSEDTLDLIKGNAENWGYTSLLILQGHYEAELEPLLMDISKLLVRDWQSRFEVAARWARRNLPNLGQEVIDHVEALIAARVEGNDNRPQTLTTEQSQVPQRATTMVATSTEGTTQDIVHSLQPAEAEPPKEQRQERQRRRRGVILTEELLLETVEQSREQPQEPQRPSVTVATMTERPTEEPKTEAHTENLLSFEEAREEDSEQDSVLGVSALADLEDLFGAAPQREADEGESAALTSRRDSVSPEPGITGPARQTLQVQAQVHREREDPEEASEDPLQTSTPTPQRKYRITRHINSERKMIDWGLSVRKKWLIIGDSNLSRIPAYDIPDLQIDSYPGANFRHAEALMTKATSSVGVEKLVLSFGLNHKGQKGRETSVKQLQGAIRAAKKRFPFAEIWIPLINFSSVLCKEDQRTLLVLNAHIEKNMPYLLRLPDSQFETEMDNVHWTKKTAGAMLRHWAQLLNLTAP